MNYRQALEIARLYHHGQRRRWSGLPYITHPMAVADMFEKEEYKVVAVLHDVLEDTRLTSYELMQDHGLDMNSIIALETLTRREGQTYLDYILGCKKFDIPRCVKIADLRHNLSDLKPGNLRDKYIMATYILGLPYINKNLCGVIEC